MTIHPDELTRIANLYAETKYNSSTTAKLLVKKSGAPKEFEFWIKALIRLSFFDGALTILEMKDDEENNLPTH